MKDQYNNPIPDDLVLLNDIKIADITTADWRKINQLDWYCYKGNFKPHIFISYDAASQINPDFASLLADSYSPQDLNPLHDLVLIDSVLHRSSVFDGWYCA